MTVKITPISKGWMMNQAGPRMVCLYLLMKSRITRYLSMSRYSSSSLRFTALQLLLALMTVSGFMGSVEAFIGSRRNILLACSYSCISVQYLSE